MLRYAVPQTEKGKTERKMDDEERWFHSPWSIFIHVRRRVKRKMVEKYVDAS